VQEQEPIIVQQQKIRAVTASLKGQAAQIQKGSVQLVAASSSGAGLEVRKSSPQILLNSH